MKNLMGLNGAAYISCLQVTQFRHHNRRARHDEQENQIELDCGQYDVSNSLTWFLDRHDSYVLRLVIL